jgi:hypothetical protein
MSYSEISFQHMLDGIQTQYGVWMSPGARVFYVHHSGGRSYDPTEVRGRTYSTLNSALQQCASGNGDTVIMLPGHAENITGADQMSGLVAGTNIIGLGWGNNRPALTWTASGSSFLLDVANVVIANTILNMDPGTGTTTVTAPMTISAAGCGLVNCRARTSTDSNSLSTVPVLLTDDANDCFLIGNRFYGATTGEHTTQVDIAGADRLVMKNNVFKGASSNTGVGIVRFKTTAATDIQLENNVYINKKASSTAAVTGVAGVSGSSLNELFGYLDTSSLTMWLTSPGLMHFREAYVSNVAGENGVIASTVSG